MSAVAERSALRRFEGPTWRSSAQVMTMAIGLAAGWVLTDKAVAVSWPLGAVSSLIIAVFTVCAFIIFHYCGHGVVHPLTPGEYVDRHHHRDHRFYHEDYPEVHYSARITAGHRPAAREF
jgi:hypothetical protein